MSSTNSTNPAVSEGTEAKVSNYRRAWSPGGTYFFTVNLSQRRNNDLLARDVDFLRNVVKNVRKRHPFTIHSWVVLPEHLHCVIELPSGDADFSRRWRLMKANFSRQPAPREHRSPVNRKRGERSIWRRRYWEHLILDERDHRAHLDYVHINPVKHGLVSRVRDWPYSTFHRLVQEGVYPLEWADGALADTLPYGD